MAFEIPSYMLPDNVEDIMSLSIRKVALLYKPSKLPLLLYP
jgi:hypothetical protein